MMHEISYTKYETWKPVHCNTFQWTTEVLQSTILSCRYHGSLTVMLRMIPYPNNTWSAVVMWSQSEKRYIFQFEKWLIKWAVKWKYKGGISNELTVKENGHMGPPAYNHS